MNKKLFLTSFMSCLALALTAQVGFTDGTSNLNSSNARSGVVLAISDMNGDGRDDLIRINSGNLEIEYQQANGSFVRLVVGSVGNPWGVAIADTDENGYNDVIVGGYYDNLTFLEANSTGTAFSSSSLNGPNIFLQNANFADIDNNGSIDFFGCHDEGVSSPYRNDGSGGLTYDLTLINAVSTVPSDNSGNYGSIWTDYDNDGDLDLYISKCRQGVSDPGDGRRLNLMFQNDGNNNYTDVAATIGLQPQTQSWASAFEDIDNDGDLDVVMVNHDVNHQIFENNGNGTFTDITSSTGIETALQNIGFGVQVMMRDFDNDGFVDILMTGRRDTGNHGLFMNDGDGTFTDSTSALNTGGMTIQSAAVGDLNHDGSLDIIAGFANGYNNPSTDADMLFYNDGNANNWSKIELIGDESNLNGIGARLELHGSWGMQIREVRAGESYGIQNSMITHFGIGTATTIDKIVVKWPSGLMDEVLNPAINTQITLNEGDNLGIDDNALVEQFSLYPNPTRDEITLSLRFNAEKLPLTIYDLGGKQVLVQEVSGFGTENIHVSNLEAGIYFVNVGDHVIKLIKQ